MRLDDDVLASDRLVFVCHSMGGIVVRKYIIERAAFELIRPGREINLFLVASPLLGFDLCGLADAIGSVPWARAG